MGGEGLEDRELRWMGRKVFLARVFLRFSRVFLRGVEVGVEWGVGGV